MFGKKVFKGNDIFRWFGVIFFEIFDLLNRVVILSVINGMY